METPGEYLGESQKAARSRDASRRPTPSTEPELGPHEALLADLGRRLDEDNPPHGELVQSWYVLGLYQALVRESLEERGYRLERRNGEAFWRWPTPWPPAAARTDGG